jgi:hypothetical protein
VVASRSSLFLSQLQTEPRVPILERSELAVPTRREEGVTLRPKDEAISVFPGSPRAKAAGAISHNLASRLHTATPRCL